MNELQSYTSSSKFYVYTLALPDGSVFYVGKGSGQRVKTHEIEARRLHHKCSNPQKCRTIRKIWAAGGEVQRTVVFETDNEEEAFEQERALIAHYGRENLCNLRYGGGGGSKSLSRVRDKTYCTSQLNKPFVLPTPARVANGPLMALRWTVEEAARRVGITKASQLAERVGIAPGTATDLWYGRPLRIDLATLQKVCDALQCTPNDLLGVGLGSGVPFDSKLAAVPMSPVAAV